MTDSFRIEPENIVVLFYYCLTCLLVKKYKNCNEALKLIQSIYQLNYATKKYIVIDYYLAKANNIQKLVSALLAKPESASSWI